MAPSRRLRKARAHTTGCQSARSVGKVETKTRSTAAKAPTLATAAMNPVTGDGDPW